MATVVVRVQERDRISTCAHTTHTHTLAKCVWPMASDCFWLYYFLFCRDWYLGFLRFFHFVQMPHEYLSLSCVLSCLLSADKRDRLLCDDKIAMQTKYGRIIFQLSSVHSFCKFKVFDCCARLSDACTDPAETRDWRLLAIARAYTHTDNRSPRKEQYYICDGRCPFGNNFSTFVKHVICYCLSSAYSVHSSWLHVVALNWHADMRH